MKPADLIAWRNRMGFSQAAAAAALGCGERTLRDYEARRSPIPLHISLACQQLEKPPKLDELIEELRRLTPEQKAYLRLLGKGATRAPGEIARVSRRRKP